MAVESEPQNPRSRGVLWWSSAVLAPLGIFGGPIAIAEMLSGAIRWGGPAKAVVAYWGEYISAPFAILVAAAAAYFSISDVPAWLSDYLALGILGAFSFFRALVLLDETMQGPTPWWTWLVVVLPLVALVVLWPLYFLFGLGTFALCVAALVWGFRDRAVTGILAICVLALAPFLGFAALYLANLLWS